MRSGDGSSRRGSGGRASAGKIERAGVTVKAALEACIVPPKPWEASTI